MIPGTLCHDRRNLVEYEAHIEIDEQLITDLLNATDILLERVTGLDPIP